MFSGHLKQYFGLSHMRPMQEKIMQSIVEKKDTFALLPTGAGKSLCYQLPAVMFPGITLVISPLLALMRDQVDSLERRGIGAARWDSTLSPGEERRLFHRVDSGKLRILYLSPEKALRADSQRFLAEVPLSHICIDEAHCISQWGWDFRPEYRRLSELITACTHSQPRPVVSAFTATATRETALDIMKSLELQQPQVFALPFQRPNLAYRVQTIRSEAEKRHNILLALQQWKNKDHGSAIIYAATRYETEELTTWLQSQGWKQAVAYHAGLRPQVREARQKQFQKNQQALLVATSAFGMGVDKPNVRLVLHHSPPPSLEAYVQEAGRAGRDGLPATALLLYAIKDLVRNWKVQESGASPERRSVLRQHAHTMQEYCESCSCLSQRIAKTFYQPPNTHLTSQGCVCSVCVPHIHVQETASPPDSESEAKFLQLKLTRKTLAAKRKIPPYFLGNDQLLVQIAKAAPQTWKELKQLSGIGHARLFYWGKEILAITKS